MHIIVETLTGNRLISVASEYKTFGPGADYDTDKYHLNARFILVPNWVDGDVVLTANYIKQVLGIELTPEEQKSETAFLRGHDGK